jgi:HK97 family phage major capsid protein
MNMSVHDLTQDEAAARLTTVVDEIEVIAAKSKLSTRDEERVDSLEAEAERLFRHWKRLERASELKEVGGRTKLVRGSAGDDYDRDPMRDVDSAEDFRSRRYRDPWNLAEVREFGRERHEVADEFKSRALSAIETMPGASPRIREAATSIIERFDDQKGTLSRQCLATSSPAYLRAWSRMARNEQHLLSVDEKRAVDEVRAMSLTDNQGGYLVPFQLDPTVIVTSAGVRSDIRQVARQVVATGDVWHGVSSGNVSWSWDAEATEVSDDSTTFAQPSIPNYKAQGFVPISIEALMDEQNVAQSIGTLLAGGKMDLEGSAFITGSGSGQPTGIVTDLVAAGSPTVVAAATDDTFALADVYTLQGSLPARYRPNATWLANNLIYNKIRAFDIYGGGGFWTNLNDERPPLLMGRSAIEAEAMDGTVTTTGATANYILIIGDFSNMVITDRIGMAVEFIPTLFGANRRPTGQRGWYAFYRTGSGVVNPGAFRMLNAASAS